MHTYTHRETEEGGLTESLSTQIVFDMSTAGCRGNFIRKEEEVKLGSNLNVESLFCVMKTLSRNLKSTSGMPHSTMVARYKPQMVVLGKYQCTSNFSNTQTTTTPSFKSLKSPFFPILMLGVHSKYWISTPPAATLKPPF